MGFLRRLLGGGGGSGDASEAGGRPGGGPVDQATIDAEERAHELELARFEQERTDDLVRRQQRFAAMSWTPPAQGGERRSDDHSPADRNADHG
jgi:hypothetical protein